MSYPTEQIPGTHVIFRRVPDYAWDKKKKRPKQSAFKPSGGGMSADWEKYATPDAALERSTNPAFCGIVSLNVQRVRDLQLRVEHTPRHPKTHGGRDNQAHCDTIEPSDIEVRMQLAAMAKVEIPWPR